MMRHILASIFMLAFSAGAAGAIALASLVDAANAKQLLRSLSGTVGEDLVSAILGNEQDTEAGQYWVVVTGPHGSVTSAVAVHSPSGRPAVLSAADPLLLDAILLMSACARLDALWREALERRSGNGVGGRASVRNRGGVPHPDGRRCAWQSGPGVRRARCVARLRSGGLADHRLRQRHARRWP